MRILVIEGDRAEGGGISTLIRTSVAGGELEVLPTLQDALWKLTTTREFHFAVLYRENSDHSGSSAVKRLREQVPDLRVLVVSSDDSDDRVIGAMVAGAAGYVATTLGPSAFAAAVRFVAEGGTYVPPKVIEKALAPRPSMDRYPLSDRQVDVLRLVAKGLANKEIARTLSITEGTVKQHMHHVCSMLGVSSRADALQKATQRGIRFD